MAAQAKPPHMGGGVSPPSMDPMASGSLKP